MNLVFAVDHSRPNILVVYADDLGESNNLAGQLPERVAEMQAQMEELIIRGRSTPGPIMKNDVEVVRYPLVVESSSQSSP